MEPFEFLKKIDALRERLPDEEVVSLYTDAETIFEDFNDSINNLNRDLTNNFEKIEGLEEEVSELEEEVTKLSSNQEYSLEGFHDNIVTRSTVDELFENLDTIPVTELQIFINKYKK